MRIDRTIVIALGTLVGATGIAAAEEPRWSVTALVGSDVGIDLGAGIQVEAPCRLRLTGTVGWMPRAYAWGLKEYYVHFYDGNAAVGEVLEDLLSGAFVARANLSFRPLADRGWFVAVGYAVQTVGKDSLIASEVEAATGRELPAADRSAARRFETSITAQFVDAALGWQWAIGSGFSLQAALGVVVIVHTSTSFDPLYTPADPSLTQAFTDAAERRLDGAGEGIVAPAATLYLGYTF